jgi:hypothetical protein
MNRPPLPPFTAETAAQKVRMAEDAWNTRDRARFRNHAISTLSRAICSTDCPLESIRLMIAIDGDMVPRATRTRSIALDSAKTPTC